jgi:thiamine pyrophosphate-dependent acetolactate synthase large subunit-like protein
MAQTVADEFVETLCAAGVKRIYVIVGDSLNGLTDALRRQGKIDWVHVGIRGFRINDPSDLQDPIAASLAHNGSALVDAVANRHEVAMPPAVSASLTKGFSPFMEAVQSGRANEVLSVARTNLWR